jgi:dihydroorotase
VLIENKIIQKITTPGQVTSADKIIDAEGSYLFPGCIDDQVHFREPGLTHKATIASESRAALAGGVTSFMEMPNVVPPSITQELLEEKYQIAARTSPANYSFYMGVTNDNLDEVLRTDPKRVCGIKAFMGSSTGNMLVDNPNTLEQLFAQAPTLIATHCEDETTVRAQLRRYQQKYGDQLTAAFHPKIRNVDACIRSSSFAVELARRYRTRLHVLHITTADELELFSNELPLENKRITAEVCVHHLHFHSGEYNRYGNRIKCNPAIKSRAHRDALLAALLDDRLDVVATDHAPHTLEEKQQPYLQAPSGLPLIQHTLQLMLEFYHAGKMTLPRIVEKMCHAPAIAFRVRERGFLDEGCHADCVLVDLDARWTVTPDNILYQCGWSPLEGRSLRGKVLSTIVNGQLAWHEGKICATQMGERLMFDV